MAFVEANNQHWNVTSRALHLISFQISIPRENVLKIYRSTTRFNIKAYTVIFSQPNELYGTIPVGRIVMLIARLTVKLDVRYKVSVSRDGVYTLSFPQVPHHDLLIFTASGYAISETQRVFSQLQLHYTRMSLETDAIFKK